MAPLPFSSSSFASCNDVYGPNFGLSAEPIAQQTFKNNETFAQKNQTYQNFLKQNEIAGKANFKETPNKLQLAQDFTGETGSIDGIPNSTENNSKFARRLASTDKNNIWPSNTGFSMFNRFQELMGNTEHFGNMSDTECLQTLVRIVKELLLVAKVIMFILILFFLIRVLERKN